MNSTARRVPRITGKNPKIYRNAFRKKHASVYPDSLQLLAPHSTPPNPIRQDPNFLPRERRTGRHLQLSFMPQDVNHQALLRISGHYSRSPGPTFQQIIPTDKRQVPVIQLLVVARQAPPGQDGGNFSIEELLIRSRREQEREHNGDHFFLPTPN